MNNCVECGEPLPESSEKIHIGCAMFSLGEVSEEERKELVEEEMSLDG